MHTVILFGSKNERQTGERLCGAFEKNGGVYFIKDNLLMLGGGAPSFLLCEYESLPETSVKQGIVIFKNEISKYSRIDIPSGFTAVVDSENAPALSLLKQRKIQTVTCGMSSHDTLSISSVKEDRAAVSLQRAIVRLDGSEMEACEIPMKFEAFPGDYALLCCCAALILTGTDTRPGLSI
ncbi:MAG TPA: hypothetical protein DEQ02_05060 [Ruminococcaceae bacterium]|nr:hypothetical protein [Oscillospiraceae bacterium]